MNAGIIFVLATPAMLMGMASVNGYTRRIEFYLWMVLAIATAIILAVNIDHHTFLHAFSVGLLWGLINGMVQAIFFEKYMQKNERFQEKFNKVKGMSPRFFVLITGTMIGSLTGLVMGGLTLFTKWIMEYN